MIIHETEKKIIFRFEYWDMYCAKEFLNSIISHGTLLEKEGKDYILPSSFKDQFYKLKEQFFGYEKEDLYNHYR